MCAIRSGRKSRHDLPFRTASLAIFLGSLLCPDTEDTDNLCRAPLAGYHFHTRNGGSCCLFQFTVKIKAVDRRLATCPKRAEDENHTRPQSYLAAQNYPRDN